MEGRSDEQLVRRRTIMFAAAGVLIVGMLIFLAIEVKRGGASGGDDDKAAASDSDRRKAEAKRAAPAPRPDRSASDDEGLEPGQRRPGGVAGSGRVGTIAVGPIAERIGGSSMAPAPMSSNGTPEQDERTAAVSAAYDHGDYQTAQAKALEVLADSPRNIKMLRVVVSTSCMFGDMARARELSARLPRKDQEDMKKRCKRFGEEL